MFSSNQQPSQCALHKNIIYGAPCSIFGFGAKQVELKMRRHIIIEQAVCGEKAWASRRLLVSYLFVCVCDVACYRRAPMPHSGDWSLLSIMQQDTA
jgi:hypothetical protein